MTTPVSSTLRLDLTNGNGTTASGRDLPPVAALFVIHFDIKAGYVISWKKCIAGVELDGVEYKSLPSGLHKLREDLVYFVHQAYAGVSAFVNVPDESNRRNALMLSVGVLVPLSYGRLGRSWRHAQNLKDIAKAFVEDTNNHQPMEEYFERFKIQEPLNGPGTPIDSPSSLRYRPSAKNKSQERLSYPRNRSQSDAATLGFPGGQALSPHHPALSLPELILTLGPLIFPLYRYALLRKRILFITDVPVEKPCNYVYDLSILSNIPLAVANDIAIEPARLRPLFNIGVHDITALEEEYKRLQSPSSTTSPPRTPPSNSNTFAAQGEAGSWVATTTDEVLKMKSSLHDLIVKLPHAHSELAAEHVWPTLEFSATGEHLKATQRDLRRYRALRDSLLGYINPPENALEPSSSEEEDETNLDPRRRFSVNFSRLADSDVSSAHEEAVCEKLSWLQLAYSSFIWWASAGEKRQDNDEEDTEGLDIGGSHNEDTLSSLLTPGTPREPPMFLRQPRRRSTGFSIAGLDAISPMGNAEMDIIAYFHRMTTRLLGTLADIIDASSDSEEDEDDDEVARTSSNNNNDDDEARLLGSYNTATERSLKGEVFISSDDLLRLGLDQFSENDEIFLQEIVYKYFGRTAIIDRPGLNVCGVKFC